MWPSCIENLKPFGYTLSEELPKFLREAFEKNGITEFVPVRIVALLGTCPTDEYMDCPNLPEWHLDNASSYDDPKEEYLADIGIYFWFDFDILDRDRQIFPLRAVFNGGDADCNDGIWGVVWDRNTGTEVAHVRSIGGDESEIEVISQKHINSYQPHNICLPEATSPEFFCGLYFVQDLELEILIGLAIQWCYLR